MGIQWAGTLLGCVAVALFPIPVVFYVYGARIRSRSAYKPIVIRDTRDSKDEEDVIAHDTVGDREAKTAV